MSLSKGEDRSFEAPRGKTSFKIPLLLTPGNRYRVVVQAIAIVTNKRQNASKKSITFTNHANNTIIIIKEYMKKASHMIIKRINNYMLYE